LEIDTMNSTKRDTLKAAQAQILDDVRAAIALAPEGTRPERRRGESATLYRERIADWSTRHPLQAFHAAGVGTWHVRRSREQLERFAAEIKRCAGFSKARKASIPREPEDRSGRDLRAATPAEAEKLFGWYSEETLRGRLATRKAEILEAMRKHWRNELNFPSSVRRSFAQDVENMQRELVRRGLLDLTDFDKVNGEALHEEIESAPLFEAVAEVAPPVPAEKPRYRVDTKTGALVPVHAIATPPAAPVADPLPKFDQTPPAPVPDAPVPVPADPAAAIAAPHLAPLPGSADALAIYCQHRRAWRTVHRRYQVLRAYLPTATSPAAYDAACRALSRCASFDPILREAAIRARRCWNGARLREICGTQVPVPAQNSPTRAAKPRMRWDPLAGRVVPVSTATAAA
jgi:hypothetical protein